MTTRAAAETVTEAALPPPDGVLGPPHRRLTLGIVALVLLIAFEAVAVATAMPVAVRDLDGLPLYAWAFSGFLTTSLLGIVVAGEWCDRQGPRLPLLAGVAAFVAGLVLAGTAAVMPVLVLARAVQGLGGGLVIVALYVVVARAYPESLRPQVFSAMSSAWVVPSLVGPVVAGWLADGVTWRLVFLGVAPLVVPAVWLMAPRLRRLDGPAADHLPRRPGRKRLALAAALGAGLLQYAGQHLAVVSLPVAAAGFALLVPSVPRLLPAGSLRLARGLPTVVVTRGLLAAAFFGAETFVPLMLVEQRHLATTLAGLSLTGGALGWATGSWHQGRPHVRLSRHRLVQAGAALVTGGVALLVVAAAPGVPAVLPAVAWAVAGTGMGLAMASLSVLVLELSPPADQGVNSAALQICDALGSVLAIGLGGVLFAAAATAGRASAATFAAIWAVMLVIGLLAVVAAPRVRPHAGPRLG